MIEIGLDIFRGTTLLPFIMPQLGKGAILDNLRKIGSKSQEIGVILPKKKEFFLNGESDRAMEVSV